MAKPVYEVKSFHGTDTANAGIKEMIEKGFKIQSFTALDPYTFVVLFVTEEVSPEEEAYQKRSAIIRRLNR